ncbi:MAG: VIT domain-containing protein, partial [Planctomycetota bacterium]|nr:VIT domain-containing protein [Planctomycetota bacterium]
MAEESLVIGLSGQRMRVTHARRGVNGATPYAHAGEVAVGRLSVKTADGKNGHYKEADLGLRTLDVATEIDGLTARTTVTHVFQNQTDELLEGVFSFALPSEAAVDRFAMTINSETDLMEGSLLDKENAKSIYSNLVYG